MTQHALIAVGTLHVSVLMDGKEASAKEVNKMKYKIVYCYNKTAISKTHYLFRNSGL